MGSRARKAGNAAEIDRLALAVVKEPGSKAFMPLAEEYGKAGMWDEAAVVLEDGLKAFPHFITAMVALGRVYEQLNQPAKAIAILEEAVKLSPENFLAHRTLAKIYAAQGVKEAGLRSCVVILSANPQDAEVLSLHATLEALVVPTPIEPPQPQTVIESVQPACDSVAAVEKTKEPQPAAVIQGEGSEATTESAAIFPEQKSDTVIQLEQWLTSIRARRRDQAVSADKNS
jgi:tetratricopeptide (TPR) repeat protein